MIEVALIVRQQVTGARATFVMDAVGNITVKSQEGTSPHPMTYNRRSA